MSIEQLNSDIEVARLQRIAEAVETWRKARQAIFDTINAPTPALWFALAEADKAMMQIATKERRT